VGNGQGSKQKPLQWKPIDGKKKNLPPDGRGGEGGEKKNQEKGHLGGGTRRKGGRRPGGGMGLWDLCRNKIGARKKTGPGLEAGVEERRRSRGGAVRRAGRKTEDSR